MGEGGRRIMWQDQWKEDPAAEESRGAQGRPVRTSAWTQTGTSGKDREANTPESIEEMNETEPGSRDLEIIRVTEKRGRPERDNQ